MPVEILEKEMFSLYFNWLEDSMLIAKWELFIAVKRIVIHLGNKQILLLSSNLHWIHVFYNTRKVKLELEKACGEIILQPKKLLSYNIHIMKNIPRKRSTCIEITVSFNRTNCIVIRINSSSFVTFRIPQALIMKLEELWMGR